MVTGTPMGTFHLGGHIFVHACIPTLKWNANNEIYAYIFMYIYVCLCIYFYQLQSK